MEQEQARRRSDGHLDLIGHLEPAATLEVLFRQENLHEAPKLLAIGLRQTPVEPDIPLDDLQPSLGERGGTQPLTAPMFEKSKHAILSLSRNRH